MTAGSWHLPLSPEGGVEPVGTAFYPEDLARRLAAAKIVGNRKAVVPFALRGVGLPGVPGVMAELADPNAKPNKDFTAPVDAALRQGVFSCRGSFFCLSQVDAWRMSEWCLCGRWRGVFLLLRARVCSRVWSFWRAFACVRLLSFSLHS